jgi:hypothetical protein
VSAKRLNAEKGKNRKRETEKQSAAQKPIVQESENKPSDEASRTEYLAFTGKKKKGKKNIDFEILFSSNPRRKIILSMGGNYFSFFVLMKFYVLLQELHILYSHCKNIFKLSIAVNSINAHSFNIVNISISKFRASFLEKYLF